MKILIILLCVVSFTAFGKINESLSFCIKAYGPGEKVSKKDAELKYKFKSKDGVREVSCTFDDNHKCTAVMYYNNSGFSPNEIDTCIKMNIDGYLPESSIYSKDKSFHKEITRFKSYVIIKDTVILGSKCIMVTIGKFSKKDKKQKDFQ